MAAVLEDQCQGLVPVKSGVMSAGGWREGAESLVVSWKGCSSSWVLRFQLYHLLTM